MDIQLYNIILTNIYNSVRNILILEIINYYDNSEKG
jgi:hypothetical protein